MTVYAKHIVCAILAFLLLSISGCVEDDAGGDGWDVGQDGGIDASSDAGSDASQDTSPDTQSDASPTCEDIDTESTCTPREECSWGEISCDAQGNPVMGCYAAAPGNLVPCRSCFEIETQTECDSRGECAWRQQVCDGEVTDEGCFPEDVLPERNCPEVPPDECEGRSPEECESIDRCAAIYPAQCGDDEVPEGVIAYDEFKCLPHIVQHGDALCEPGLSDCPDGYECGEVWAGCPPDVTCFACASTAEVCLPVDAP